MPGTVVLYDHTWVDHISTKHSDVPLHEIHTTMLDPCEVCTSKTTGGSLIMVNTNAVNEHGDQLRVPVKPQPNGTNIVTSAYYGMTPHGPVIWKRGDA